MADQPQVVLVMMTFDATDLGALLGVLAKYVVLSRGQPDCRNIDLCASATVQNRVVVVAKWGSEAAQRAHFDSPEMVEMAQACTGILASPPQIDLLEALSAHDLA